VPSELDRTVAGQAEAHVVTRSGVRLVLRPVSPDDGDNLRKLLACMTPSDLRFRFLASQKEPDEAALAQLLAVDHRRTEHLLAFDVRTGEPVASLMIAADAEMETAEVAIAVASGARNRGIGWALLRHAATLAKARGIKRLQAIESRENHDALEVERALGFETRAIDGDPTVVLLEADLA